MGIKKLSQLVSTCCKPRVAAAVGLALILAPSYALTLEESVASAMLNDPNLKQAFARLKIIESNQSQSSAEYLPTVLLTGGTGVERVGKNNDVDVDGDATKIELGLLVRQSLFSGFSTKYDVERLGHEAEAERLKLYAEAEEQSMAVIEVYLNLIAAQTILELSKRNQEDHESILEDIKVKVNNQLVPQSDLAQIQARLANARASTIAAHNRVVDLESEYVILVGTDPESLVDPVPNFDYIPTSQDEALTRALEEHYSIKSSKEDIRATHKEYKAAGADYYPEFYLEAQANLHDNDSDASNYPSRGESDDISVMLKMEFELYSGGKTSSQQEASSWRIQEAKNVLSSNQRQIRQNVLQTWSSYQLLADQEEYLKANVASSAEATDGYLEQFKVGRRELLDLLISKTDLFQARKAYVETSVQQKIATYRLKYATGNLLRSLYIEFPQEWQGEK